MALKNLAVPTILTLIAFSMLVGLGVWQVQRLAWKRDLIAKLDARASEAPVGLSEALRRQAAGEDIAHLRVSVVGEFMHQQERHLYSLAGGRAGWRVITPLRLASGGIVFVDRGFVTHQMKQAETRLAGQLSGSVETVGQIRLPAPRSAFALENQPQENEWYWRDLAAMAEQLGRGPAGELLPLMIDAEANALPGGWPKGGVARIKPSNRHLGYAITWFSLAAILLLIYALFVRSQLRRR